MVEVIHTGPMPLQECPKCGKMALRQWDEAGLWVGFTKYQCINCGFKKQFPESDSPCFVATSVYDSGSHPNVELLRRFRDEVLLRSQLGRKAVATYYQIGPGLAQATRRRDWLKRSFRLALDIFVFLLRRAWRR